MSTRAAWVIAVVAASVAWSAPAGAATVDGSLQVTEVTTKSVTYTATSHRACADGEQCDYYSEVDQVDGDGPCPDARPENVWITWTSTVENTGPTSEAATVAPRGWDSKDAIGPSRLCLYIYAELSYYLAANAKITRPPLPPASTPPPGGSDPGGTGPGASPPKPGGSTPPKSSPRVRTLGTTTSAKSTKTALRRAYGKSFTKGTRYRARCARRSRTSVRCTVSWRYRGKAWKGYVDVTGTIRKGKQTIVTRVHVRRP